MRSGDNWCPDRRAEADEEEGEAGVDPEEGKLEELVAEDPAGEAEVRADARWARGEFTEPWKFPLVPAPERLRDRRPREQVEQGRRQEDVEDEGVQDFS